MPDLIEDRRVEGQDSTSTQDQDGTCREMVGTTLSDQIISGSVSGSDEKYSSTRIDSRSSGRDGVESQGKDGSEDRETNIQFIPG